MDFIRNAKIKTRLVAGFATILSLLIVTTVVGVVQVNSIDNSLTTINDVNGLKQRYAINFRGSVHDRAIAVRDVIVLTDATEVTASVEEIRRLEAFYTEAATGMDQVFADPALVTDAEREILAGIQEIEAQTLPLIESVIDKQRAGDLDAARAVLENDARPAFVTWLARINTFIDLQESNNGGISDNARTIAQNFAVLMLSITVVCIAIGVGFAVWSIKSIRQLNVLTPNMLALADGNLDVDIPDRDTRDEVGEITRAVQVFKRNAIEARRNADEAEELRRQNQESEERAKEQQAEAMKSLAIGFEKDVMGIVDSLSESSTMLRQSAEGLSQTADQAQSKTEDVANSSNQASNSVGTVAQSSSRIEDSIRNISGKIGASSAKTRDAASQASEANQIIDGLSAKAESIGEVVNLISDIAAQTNLLALNATIEAARAGEAGKGFAVVASEVKSLATQTTRATDDISTRVAEIQDATDGAVNAIKRITTTIDEVNDIASDISGAVDQQQEATSNIVVHVEQATDSTDVVATAVSDLRQVSSETQQSSQRLLTSAGALSDQSTALRGQVETFLSSIRNDAA